MTNFNVEHTYMYDGFLLISYFVTNTMLHEWNNVNSGYALSYQEEKFGVISQYFRQYATL